MSLRWRYTMSKLNVSTLLNVSFPYKIPSGYHYFVTLKFFHINYLLIWAAVNLTIYLNHKNTLDPLNKTYGSSIYTKRSLTMKDYHLSGYTCRNHLKYITYYCLIKSKEVQKQKPLRAGELWIIRKSILSIRCMFSLLLLSTEFQSFYHRIVLLVLTDWLKVKMISYTLITQICITIPWVL